MSTAIGSSYLTLLDYAKREKPEGGIADIIEVLTASNPIIADASVMEGNLTTGHRSVQRATLPSGTWRQLNYGVASEKSTTVQRDDTCGMLESYSEVDVAIANLGGNAAAFRASEDNAFVAGLSSTAATAIFYGNQGVNPEQIQGLGPRYSLTTGDYSSQIINASGSTALTSVWLVTWGPKTCSLIYPKGQQAGLKAEDLGKVTAVDSSSLMHEVYRTHFIWNIGLALLDYRYVIRICNISTTDLTDDASTGADLLRRMTASWFARQKAEGYINYPSSMAKTFWYCASTVAEYLTVQAQNKANVQLSMANPGGEPVVSFYGAPIHICDNITIAETAIS